MKLNYFQEDIILSMIKKKVYEVKSFDRRSQANLFFNAVGRFQAFIEPLMALDILSVDEFSELCDIARNYKP